jgi:hypothetical protein
MRCKPSVRTLGMLSVAFVATLWLLQPVAWAAAEPSPTTRPSAVHLPTPPKGDGDQKVLTMARTELGRVRPGRGGRAPSQPPDLTTLAVRPLTTAYAIDAASLAEGKGMDAAKPRNLFAYAAVLNGQVRGIGHVQITGDTTGAVSSFEIVGDRAGVAEGTLVRITGDTTGAASNLEIGGGGAGLAEGIDAVGALEQLRGGSYEVRQLTLPPTVLLPHTTQVLWLKADTGPDFIYTLKEPAYPGRLNTQTLYPIADFLKVVQPWMVEALKAPPMPPGAGG